MRKALLAAFMLWLLTGCTPDEIEGWLEWHADDPTAALAHLEQPEVQAALAAAPAVRLAPPEPERSVWDRLAQCESGGNWAIATGNGYYGGLQFSLTSWRAVGGTGYPHQHSRAEQINRAERLLDIQGWGAWPGCSRKLGLR